MANASIYNYGPEYVQNGQVASAVKPGVIVMLDSNGKFTPTTGTGDANKRLFVLDKASWRGQGIETAYEADALCRCYELTTGLSTQARIKDGTYVKHQALTCDANGYLIAAAAGKEIVGYLREGDEGTIAQSDTGKLVNVEYTNRPAAT